MAEVDFAFGVKATGSPDNRWQLSKIPKLLISWQWPDLCSQGPNIIGATSSPHETSSILKYLEWIMVSWLIAGWNREQGNPCLDSENCFQEAQHHKKCWWPSTPPPQFQRLQPHRQLIPGQEPMLFYGLAKSSLGFFYTILQKHPNELFGQPNISISFLRFIC